MFEKTTANLGACFIFGLTVKLSTLDTVIGNYWACAPCREKTFCSSHWYLEDKKGWGGLQLHDYDELSMNYCNCMILYEQFVDHSDNEPWKTMFSPSLHAFFWDSHHQYKSWWSGHTWNGLYSTVVCCCLPKRPSLAVEPLHLSKWKRSKMKLEKQGRNPWPSFHIPAQNEILGPGLSKASLQC